MIEMETLIVKIAEVVMAMKKWSEGLNDIINDLVSRVDRLELAVAILGGMFLTHVIASIFAFRKLRKSSVCNCKGKKK